VRLGRVPSLLTAISARRRLGRYHVAKLTVAAHLNYRRAAASGNAHRSGNPSGWRIGISTPSTTSVTIAARRPLGNQARAAQHGEQEPPTRRLQDAHSRRRPRRRRHDRNLRLAPRADPGRGAGTDRRDTQRLCRFRPLHADVNLTRPRGCFGSQPIAVTLVMTFSEGPTLRGERPSVAGACVVHVATPRVGCTRAWSGDDRPGKGKVR
jgi:hypothetical protein